MQADGGHFEHYSLFNKKSKSTEKFFHKILKRILCEKQAYFVIKSKSKFVNVNLSR